MAYNRIVIVGNLAQDPELHQAADGVAVTNFTVAVARCTAEGTDFINCAAWRNVAEFVCDNFNKGKPILVEGELRSRKYKNHEGLDRTA